MKPFFLLPAALILLSAFPSHVRATTAPKLAVVLDFSAFYGYPFYSASSVIVGNDGSLYGTVVSDFKETPGGIYRLSPDGHSLRFIYLFNGYDNGPIGVISFQRNSYARLLQAADGWLYGTTDNVPGVYRVAPDGSDFQEVYSFRSGFSETGYSPKRGLIQASDGNLYGVNPVGGLHGDGAVFMLTPDGTTARGLHSFSRQTDGGSPDGELLLGADGWLYGTTSLGGAGGLGAVFRLAVDGTGFELLHAFTSAEGGNPQGALIQADDGRLYGTACGTNGGSLGTVFRLATDGTGFEVLHTFVNTDGSHPVAPLLQASDGNLYAATSEGGLDDDGVAFALAPGGTDFSSVWLDRFNAGKYSYGGLVQGGSGLLYGTAASGGGHGYGTVFSEDAGLPPVVQFHAAINSVNETAGMASVRVDRVGDDGSAVFVVPYTLADGTAKVGTDYTDGGDGTLVWVTGDTTPKFIMVNIVNRSLTDASLRTLSLVLGPPLDLPSGSTDSGYPSTATLTINGSVPGVPIIESARTAKATAGQPFSYQIVASGKPTRYGVQGMPQGWTVDADTGLIQAKRIGGTGNYQMSLRARNAAGTGSATLTVTSTLGAPVITSDKALMVHFGDTFTYQITASGFPRRYGVLGLGEDTTVNAATGLVTGAPLSVGDHTLTVQASNAGGVGTQDVTLTVDRIAPIITSSGAAQGTLGAPFNYTIMAAHGPGSFGVTGLPPSLHVDAKTGKITGTPTKAGTFTLTLKGANAAGSDSKTLTLMVGT